MRKSSIPLWVCIAYFGVVLLRIAVRASWGYVHVLDGDDPTPGFVPVGSLITIANDAAAEFKLHVLLVGIGVALLLANAIWYSRDSRGSKSANSTDAQPPA